MSKKKLAIIAISVVVVLGACGALFIAVNTRQTNKLNDARIEAVQDFAVIENALEKILSIKQ